ncbi:hypothetical protein TNIN_124031 [Trichonephila inaurata madagascariensis]|uniref:Uncharacterized protein n=1 Tax=Trichonephila inaurata madagascariensis TaxID=2747483 RepID=A0A8X6XID2_9ARAC|nr:hypothetical protein TNIN_124031 [Trichonephila inaurata madagascariensis]
MPLTKPSNPGVAFFKIFLLFVELKAYVGLMHDPQNCRRGRLSRRKKKLTVAVSSNSFQYVTSHVKVNPKNNILSDLEVNSPETFDPFDSKRKFASFCVSF